MPKEKKSRSHAVVRFDPVLTAKLEKYQSNAGARFRGPVIEKLLLDRLVHGEPPLQCRPDPRSEKVVDLWISSGVMRLLRSWVARADVTVGDMIYTLLSEELAGTKVQDA